MRRLPQLIAALVLSCVANGLAQNQTSSFSPVILNGNLPYEIKLHVHDLSGGKVPTLQSFAVGSYKGEWVLVAGRTNGLHNFTNSGLKNFPPAFQNTRIWVIDPLNERTWSRSIVGGAAGLSSTEVTALSATATAFGQIGSQLYIAGGYVYDREKDNFTTFDTLTALDLPEVIDWVKTGAGALRDHVRQTQAPFLKVAGGVMCLHGTRAFLVFGQDFEGPYKPGSNGVYTRQIRGFDIVDNGNTVKVQNFSTNKRRDDFRRRDLNVVPFLERNKSGGFREGFVALSGVFLPGKTGGVWTVPVEIDKHGNPSTEEANAYGTFRQGMNNYNSATASLYSKREDESHTISFGGISLRYFNKATGAIAYDSEVPFINGITSIVRKGVGNYRQYYLGEYPTIPNPTNNNLPFLFGAEAAFLPVPGLKTYDNGMLDLDNIGGRTVIGHVVGGIVAEQPNFGATAASNYIFTVTLEPKVRFKVSGSSQIKTSASAVKIRGTASAAAKHVDWKIGADGQMHRELVRDGEWSARIAGLKPNTELTVYFRAVGEGHITPFKKVTISRR